jgi:hypothetical protein
MTATAFVKTALPISTAVTGVALTLAACDATNGNSIASTGSEVVIVLNTDSSAHTFTITGVPDPSQRTANFSMSVPGSAALATASIVVTPRLSQAFWSAANTILTPNSNSALLFVGVLTGV